MYMQVMGISRQIHVYTYIYVYVYVHLRIHKQFYAGDGRFARGNGEQGSWEVEEREGKIILRLEWDRCATEELQVWGNALQHISTHCNTLHDRCATVEIYVQANEVQHTATHCNTLQDRCVVEELQVLTSLPYCVCPIVNVL